MKEGAAHLSSYVEPLVPGAAIGRGGDQVRIRDGGTGGRHGDMGERTRKGCCCCWSGCWSGLPCCSYLAYLAALVAHVVSGRRSSAWTATKIVQPNEEQLPSREKSQGKQETTHHGFIEAARQARQSHKSSWLVPATFRVLTILLTRDQEEQDPEEVSLRCASSSWTTRPARL